MNSHEALIDYAKPLASGKSRICLDLFAAIPNSFGQTHEAMVKHFSMVECGAVPGLMTLRSKCNQAAFLEFFGESWGEAITKWPTLAFFHEYRQKHGEDNYLSVVAWQTFYQLVGDGVEPASIDIMFIEHG